MKTKLVGILNVTPDSFSDGGEYLDSGDALAKISELIMDGADVIDIGAESTRPGATVLSHDDEWQRLFPVLSHVSGIGVPISIDTRHAQTAAKSLQYGVKWINDVSGFADDAMLRAVAPYDCNLVLMHSLSVPADKSIILPESTSVIEELLKFAHTRMGYIEKLGISKSRLIFDPGIGFGKNAKQSWEIIKNIRELKTLGIPVLVGHSRKSFLGKSSDSDLDTLAVSLELAAAGVDYLRVHNVALHRKHI